MIKISSKLGLLTALLVLAGLLVACGGEEANPNATNGSFTLPIYSGLNEIPALAANPEFVKRVLPEDKNFTERTVRVFSTTTPVSEVKGYYEKELLNLGWSDRSKTLLGIDTLGADGWVLGFEKPSGNNTGRSRGLVMLGPNASGTNNILKQYRDSGALPSGQNVLVVVDGLYSLNGTPSAPTATPRP